MDLSPLQEAGLTPGEIKVYLALLELGSSTTGPIIEKSGVARSIIYQLLEKLMEKGLASYIVRERTKHYQAAQPAKLLDYIDQREEDLRENRRKIQDLLGELQLKQALASKSIATIYTGHKGVQTAHERTYERLERGEQYYYLGIYAVQEPAEHAYWQRDHRRRVEAGIKCRLLFNADTPDWVLKDRNSYEGCNARWMPTDIKTPAQFLIYKDTTLIFILKGQSIAVEIVNQEIADSFKAYFDSYWKRSKAF